MSLTLTSRPRYAQGLAVECLEDRVTPVSFVAGFGTFLSASTSEAVGVGDINGDGKQDFVVANGAGGAIPFINDGNDQFTAMPAVPIPDPRAVDLVDMNGDGKPDLVIPDGDGYAVAIALGNGDGTFQAPIFDSIGNTGAEDDAIADFNGDGKPDVAVASGGLVVMLNNGSSSILGPPTIYDSGADALALTVADFNGDGKMDVALSGFSTDRVDILFGNGDGTFQAPVSYPIDGEGARITAGDLTNDGHPDIIVQYYGGATGLLMNNGNGTFQPVHDLSFGVAQPRLADLNEDGNLDLVSTLPNTGNLAVYLGNGAGGFASPVLVPAADDPGDVAVGDFNNDGLPDLVSVGTTSPGSVQVDLNTTPVVSSFALSTVTSSTAGQGFDVTVTAKDSSNATFTSYVGTVHFSSNDPQATAGNGLPADYQFVASDNGVHTFDNVTLKTAGTITITVTDSVITSAQGSSTVVVKAAAAVAINPVSGSGQSAMVTQEYANPLVAVVEDQYGNPVSGLTVSFAGPGSGAGVTFPFGATAITAANGQASVRVTADTISGAYTVTATVSGVSAPASFSLTNTAGPATSIAAVSGGGQAATVGTAFTNSLVAIVEDQYGNPVSGVTVSFAGPGSGAGVTFPSGTTATTGANGQASVPVTADTIPGAYTVAVTTIGVASSASFSLTNTAGKPESIAEVSGGGQSATVGAAFGNSLVALVEDDYGNPVSGVTVTFAGPSSGAGVTFPSGATATTGTNRQANVPVMANIISGGYTVTASVTGVFPSASFSLTNTAGVAKIVALASGNGQSATVTAEFAHPLAAVVTDQYGNPVSGVTVTFAGPGSGAGVTFPSGATAITGTNGQASVPVTADTVSGAFSVTASATGISTPAAFSLTNTAGSARTITPVSGGGQSAIVGTAFTNPLVVLVEDQYGNPDSGMTVTFAGPGSGAGVTFPSGSTATIGANGEGSLAVSADTIDGVYAVMASVPGVSAPVSFSLTNTVGASNTIGVVSGSGQSATVGTAFTNSLVAVVTDQYGNPESGVKVTFAGPASGAGVTFPSGATATTGSNGQASVSVTANTVAGADTVTATAKGVLAPTSFSLTNTAGIATTLTVVSGGGQSATAGATFANPLVAIVTDQ